MPYSVKQKISAGWIKTIGIILGIFFFDPYLSIFSLSI